jgi:DNA-binding transcriptional ArsR family regulator
MTSREQVASFIRSSFRSVWSLELLLLLKREPRSWRHEEIVAALRASDLIVSQSLSALGAAGLVAIDEVGSATYRPVSDGAARLVEGAERLYARSPDAVRRLIIGSSASGLAAFADAFRLRKD